MKNDNHVLFSAEQLEQILPHRPPFLFVDKVTSLTPFKSIRAERFLDPDEAFFPGHFPGKAIMPGVLTTEALAQTCGLLSGLSRMQEGSERPVNTLYFLAAAQMKFLSPAYPGQTLILDADLDRSYGQMSRYQVEALVENKLIATGTITLAEAKA